jgi:Carboxypeptidase regulatory-like domain
MSVGQPIGGIKIMLEGSLPTSTMTDANGNYVFSNLRDGGSYTVTPGGKMNFMPPSRSFNDLRQDGSADFSVPPELYEISGRVMSAGQPVDGVQIILTGAKTASTRTNGSGNYTFDELQAGGSYTITPGVKMNLTPASRSFNNLRQNESADFSVRLEVYKISGRVMSATRPLGGIKVKLEGSKLTSVTTDVDGNYTFADLRAGGSYTITPQASTSFKPASHFFDNLRRNEAADFLESTPPPECLETEKKRIGSSLVARFGELWQRNIERERSRIISEALNVDVKNAVATLRPIEFQPTVSKCSAALVTARYSWEVKTELPSGLKVVNVSKVKRFLCTKVLGEWHCF